MQERKCNYCGEPLTGRVDKKFCNAYCKSAFQYEQKKRKPKSLFNRIDTQLKLNRRLLKEYNKEGVTTIREEVLLQKGFNPRYFTHYWKNDKGEVYLFCYEYGFLRKRDSRKNAYRFILVQWQTYME